MNRQAFCITATATAALAMLGIGLVAWQFGWVSTDGARPGTRGTALVGGPFSLVDHTGQARTDKDFAGKLMLVYFGYISCPDVCPIGLRLISTALGMMGDDAKEVQPIFITVDPARDTVSKMAEYVKIFHSSLIGLTGPEANIAEAAKAYRVYYQKSDSPPKHSHDYLLGHSSIIFLMDRQGRYLAHFSHRTKPELIARQITENL